jgi:hypothetical protein
MRGRTVASRGALFATVRTTLVVRWVRTGATLFATLLTGAALALVLTLIRGTDARTDTLAFALVAALDPVAEWVFCASFPIDVPTGDLASAYEEVAVKARPRTTPALATRILSSQRAPATPA